MTGGIADYMSGSSDPAAASEAGSAMAFGSQHAFMFALIVGVIGFVISLFIRRVKVEGGARPTSMH
ncbi:DHA2 family lincomycin resistance protein-like MFS transporter [Paenibacillus methanolicus]|uniref:DHA2 family lincomycin resistance protein-like MFS transporter n=1 Tax=Paenibacillus methanolicus TaxID=582686 RepID=A0A5S5C3T0_9BACL|nr:DHA2 family lincomycin resistance protein-like MFS transporter [Paenibacillus methanolicus]